MRSRAFRMAFRLALGKLLRPAHGERLGVFFLQLLQHVS